MLLISLAGFLELIKPVIIAKIIAKMWRDLDGTGRATWEQRTIQHRRHYPIRHYRPRIRGPNDIKRRIKSANVVAQQTSTPNSLNGAPLPGPADNASGPDPVHDALDLTPINNALDSVTKNVD